MDIWKKFDQNVITHSAAHHLMAVDALVNRLGYARVSDIARQLNITRGSVSISLKPMKEAGLIVQDENRHLKLSKTGQRLVDAVKTKRQLIERLLSELLGVNGEQSQIDACKIEHLTSNETARHLVSFFRFIDTDDEATRRFLAKWRDYALACDSDPKSCPTCADTCMARNVPDS